MSYTLTAAEVYEAAQGGPAPELAPPAVVTAQWTEILSQVGEQVNASAWGSDVRAKMGARYLAAHIATKYADGNKGMAGTASAAGPVTEMHAGQVGKSMATPAALSDVSLVNADLLTTRYGREFLRLCRLFCARVIVL